jgi:hypothetical protein
MDTERFDQLARQLVERRTARRGLLATLLAGLGLAHGLRETGAAGPCGNGSAKANTCRRKNQCCTRLCDRRKERCTCRRQGQPCKQDRNCCRPAGRRLVCSGRRCRPAVCGNGGPCRVFVTSSEQNGALGGLAGADAICQDLAESPGSQAPPGTYLAWLSDDTDSPSSRFMRSPGPYVLVNAAATRIAANWAALTDGTLDAPIDVTEDGARLDGREVVWTNTDADGKVAPKNLHCVNWTDGSNVPVGATGETERRNSLWTNTGQGGCNNQLRLYCFQQG